MATDLIVGMATSYGWKELEPFVTSLKRSGYAGRCVLICENTIEGVETVPPDEMHEHPFRARHLLLAKLVTDDYRYVITCDTRDIIFQSDPVKWLERNLGSDELVVTTEGITFRNCPGYDAILRENFPDDYLLMVDRYILSMGVVGGKPGAVRELLVGTHELCRGVPGDEDQAAMNVYIHRNPKGIRIATSRDGWVSNHNQTGGREVRHGIVYPAGSEEPYSILHQWQYVLPQVHGA